MFYLFLITEPGFVALQIHCNGKYVQATMDGDIDCKSDEIGQYEKFEVQNLGKVDFFWFCLIYQKFQQKKRNLD